MPLAKRHSKQAKERNTKNMKKKIIIIFASIAGSALFLAATFAVCSTLITPPQPSNKVESGSITIPEHLSPSESDTSSHTLFDDISETEETIPQTSSAILESMQSSEALEESSIETPSPVSPSLEFTTNGNGTCSVSGIGSITDSYVTIPLRSPEGDIVTSISEKAFFCNDHIRAVEIPSTISYIGDMAFAGCSELVYLSVDKSNKSFIDIGGILFSCDMTKLLAYPSASGASTITIPTSVTKISPMAFFACNNLKTINFEGTVEQWSKINIGDMNYGLYSTSIICTSTSK